MIQRIQTLYLLLTLIIIGLMFFYPVAEFYEPEIDSLLETGKKDSVSTEMIEKPQSDSFEKSELEPEDTVDLVSDTAEVQLAEKLDEVPDNLAGPKVDSLREDLADTTAKARRDNIKTEESTDTVVVSVIETGFVNFKITGLEEEINTKKEIPDTLSLVILTALIAIIALFSVFLFKKRVLQMRLSMINIFLMIGQLGLIYYFIYAIADKFDFAYNFKIAIVFPIVGIILTILAYRAIRRDELLVRSMDRIR